MIRVRPAGRQSDYERETVCHPNDHARGVIQLPMEGGSPSALASLHMKIANGAGVWGLVVASALLSSGCNKKAEGGTTGAGSAAETTTTAAPTGIKGTFRGKPWAGKVAFLKPDSDGPSSKLYIKAMDAQCKMPDIMGDEVGMVQITSVPKKGVTPFDKDNTYGELFVMKGSSTSSSDTSNGEIEWITVPTATTKGLARLRLQKDPDTRIEGSMEVSLCPPKK
jgi:hypothetical protein